MPSVEIAPREQCQGMTESLGWNGSATSGYSDPKEDLVAILMTQRLMDSPRVPAVYLDFWTQAYQAIDD